MAALEAAYVRGLVGVAEAVARVGAGSLRELRRATRALERVSGALARVERWNARVRAKRAMLEDACWRAEVRAHLGGAAGLARWERRAAEAAERLGAERLGTERLGTTGAAETGAAGSGARSGARSGAGCGEVPPVFETPASPPPRDEGCAEGSWMGLGGGEFHFGEMGAGEMGAEDTGVGDVEAGSLEFGLPRLPGRGRERGRDAMERKPRVGGSGLPGLPGLTPLRVQAERVMGRAMARAVPVWPCELRTRAERRAERAGANRTQTRQARALPTRGEFGGCAVRALEVAQCTDKCGDRNRADAVRGLACEPI